MIDFEDYKRVIRSNNTSVIKYHLYCNVCNTSKGLWRYFAKLLVICRFMLKKRDRIFWLWDRLSQIIATCLNKGSVTESPSPHAVVTEVVLNYIRIPLFKIK